MLSVIQSGVGVLSSLTWLSGCTQVSMFPESCSLVACSMQDLADRNLKFGIDAGGVTQYYFEHPHDQLTRDLSDQWVPFSTLDEGTKP